MPLFVYKGIHMAKQKIAVITGASSGIGHAITIRLLNEKYKVYGLSRTKPDFKDVNFVWLKLDLLNRGELNTLSSKIAEKKIDLLVNNAGTAIPEDSLDCDSLTFEKTFNLNFLAPILVCKSLIGKLKGALIVNISSLSDRIPDNEFAMYCASKAALNIYFDSIQTKYHGFKVINILPSYVDTPLLRKLIGSEPFDWEEVIQPENIAHLVLQLLDNDSIPANSRVFVVTDALFDDVKSKENIFVYNATRDTLATLEESLLAQ